MWPSSLSNPAIAVPILIPSDPDAHSDIDPNPDFTLTLTLHHFKKTPS